MKTVLAVIGALFLLFVFALFALCNDDDDEPESLGRGQPELAARLAPAYHEDDRCQGYECRDGGSGNEGEYRDDNRRGGISPGPFDRSPVDFRDNRVTICFPFASCRQDPGDDRQPPEGGQRPFSEPNPACLISVPYRCDPEPAA